MNSSLRSKLFLITYGTILAFIAGLIIFNNTILRNYYTFRRNTHLIEAFVEAKDLDQSSSDYVNRMAVIESEYNLSIQVVYQEEEINKSMTLDELKDDESLFSTIYGHSYWMNQDDVITFIYEYHQAKPINGDFEIARSVDVESTGYRGYLFDWETNNQEHDDELIGLFVVKPVNQGYIYYFNTITLSSINENIWIFNSFTVVLGMFFMVVSAIVMYFLSYKLTNPILEINRVANEIANLNFSDKAFVASEDEIGHLAKSINIMSDELKNTIEELKVSNKRLAEEILFKNQVEKQRKEFIASASHELKTPLSLIMGYSEALKLDDLSKEDKDNYIDIVIDETYKMNKLVRELLNISQIDSGIISINQTQFSIKKLVQSTYNLLAIKINEKNIDFNMEIDDIIIYSDYEQLQTVLINFINNALNHVKEPNQISVYTKIEKEYIRLYVYNSGDPIPEEDIKNLWDSFYKVDKARTRSYGGHGLGLSIARTIFESLDYKYGVENNNQGVSFYFDINFTKSIEADKLL